MNNEVKENDVVKHKSPAGTDCIARVRWVNEKGEVGVTYMSPESYKGNAQVVDIDGLEVIEEGIGDLSKTSTTELIAAIKRLRGMRLIKKPTARSPRARKTSVKSKLDALLAEGGSELDGLIQKAIKEIKEEKG